MFKKSLVILFLSFSLNAKADMVYPGLFWGMVAGINTSIALAGLGYTYGVSKVTEHYTMKTLCDPVEEKSSLSDKSFKLYSKENLIWSVPLTLIVSGIAINSSGYFMNHINRFHTFLTAGNVMTWLGFGSGIGGGYTYGVVKYTKHRMNKNKDKLCFERDLKRRSIDLKKNHELKFDGLYTKGGV